MSLTFMLTVGNLFAYQFSPLEQVFGPTGAESTKTYTILNDGDDSIAIEISAMFRDQDELGAEINTPATAYFSIVPNKVIVKPQSSQIVRVQYRGPKTVTNELAFRLKAEQIPYSKGKDSTEKGMFNFLYIYTTSLYVSPSKAIENIMVRSIVPTVADDGAETMAITVSNLGNVHQLLVASILEITDSKGNSVTLEGTEALSGFDGMNVLAKKTVTKQVPWPAVLSREPGVTYKSKLTYTSN
ncbi:fimbria/pilus periplasmic chaperone [Sphaerochaeta pleomorpha]|nr:fimbria/pilus periplasmic chaperone [Sphaerochaeta pleomorpha]